jgi:hypothetical protein
LTDKELEHIERKKLLSLLNELNDIEVIRLKKFSFDASDSNEEKKNFYETHSEVFKRPDTMVGSGSFSQTEFDKKVFQESYMLRLVNLRLIKRIDSMNINQIALNEIESSNFCISDLGQLLIRFINLKTKE